MTQAKSSVLTAAAEFARASSECARVAPAWLRALDELAPDASPEMLTALAAAAPETDERCIVLLKGWLLGHASARIS